MEKKTTRAPKPSLYNVLRNINRKEEKRKKRMNDEASLKPVEPKVLNKTIQRQLTLHDKGKSSDMRPDAVDLIVEPVKPPMKNASPRPRP